MEKATTKTAHQIDSGALDFAESLLTEMMTAGLATDGFMASADVDDDGGWYMGDTDLTALGNSTVVLSPSLEFEDAQSFASASFSAYEDVLSLATRQHALSYQDVYEIFRSHSVRTWNDSSTWFSELNHFVKRNKIDVVTADSQDYTGEYFKS